MSNGALISASTARPRLSCFMPTNMINHRNAVIRPSQLEFSRQRSAVASCGTTWMSPRFQGGSIGNPGNVARIRCGMCSVNQRTCRSGGSTAGGLALMTTTPVCACSELVSIRADGDDPDGVMSGHRTPCTRPRRISARGSRGSRRAARAFRRRGDAGPRRPPNTLCAHRRQRGTAGGVAPCPHGFRRGGGERRRLCPKSRHDPVRLAPAVSIAASFASSIQSSASIPSDRSWLPLITRLRAVRSPPSQAATSCSPRVVNLSV